MFLTTGRKKSGKISLDEHVSPVGYPLFLYNVCEKISKLMSNEYKITVISNKTL